MKINVEDPLLDISKVVLETMDNNLYLLLISLSKCYINYRIYKRQNDIGRVDEVTIYIIKSKYMESIVRLKAENEEDMMLLEREFLSFDIFSRNIGLGLILADIENWMHSNNPESITLWEKS